MQDLQVWEESWFQFLLLRMYRWHDTAWLAGCHGFSPYSKCNFSNATLQSINSKPTKSSKICKLGGWTDSVSICKEIDVEDVGAKRPCGRPAAMDSARNPNAFSLMQLCNQSTINQLGWNDSIIMPSRHNKIDLLLNSQKKCDTGQHFLFCCIWVMWWRCVARPHHMTADIFIFIHIIFAIFAMQSISNIFRQIPTDKNHSESSEAEHESSNILIDSPVKKTSENFLTQKICNSNTKKATFQMHCAESPLVSLWLWENFLFSFFNQFWANEINLE